MPTKVVQDYRTTLKAAQDARAEAQAKRNAEHEKRQQEEDAKEGLFLAQVLNVFGIDPDEELTKNEYVLDGVRYSASGRFDHSDGTMSFKLSVDLIVPQADEEPFFDWRGTYRRIDTDGWLSIDNTKHIDELRAELGDHLDNAEKVFAEQLPKYEAWLANRNQPAPATDEPHTRFEVFLLNDKSDKRLSSFIDKGYRVIAMNTVAFDGDVTAIVMLSKAAGVLPLLYVNSDY